MPVIKFINDNTSYNFDSIISIIDIAKIYNNKIAKYCIAGRINNKIVDITENIIEDSEVSFITYQDIDSIKIIRQSCLYFLGYIIKKIWPNAKMVKNKLTENGFYYDIDLDYQISKKDLKKIENYMHFFIEKKPEILKKKVSFIKAKQIFINLNENYKVYILEKKLFKKKYINLYLCEKYVDISKGPIAPNMNFCNNFVLDNVSGIYWKKEKNEKVLQRIYGFAHQNEKKLNIYINFLKESKKRDHRKIGKKLDLYHTQDDTPGMIYWHNNGWIIYREIKNFIRNMLSYFNYQEVNSPLIINKELWKKTGHWKYYKESIFTTFSEKKEYCIKPMNCPGHVQIFNQKLRSYRELPLRIAEFGYCHRNESSGSLHGLIRARNFTQDDAHIFCTKSQISNEINHCINIIFNVYKTFGFKKILVKLSTRPGKRIGDDYIWNITEKALQTSLQENKIKFDLQKGEGAFYGPKIEFILCDSLNRKWQCGTIQLDFSLPTCLDSFYIDKKNQKKHPIMIHRAILGSIERFIGILIEEYSGRLPTWLSPIQIVILNISEKQSTYAKKIAEKLKKIKLRIKLDLRNEKISFKIREYSIIHVPYMIICGEKEIKNKQISVRYRNDKSNHLMSLELFIKKIQEDINNKNIYQ